MSSTTVSQKIFYSLKTYSCILVITKTFARVYGQFNGVSESVWGRPRKVPRVWSLELCGCIVQTWRNMGLKLNLHKIFYKEMHLTFSREWRHSLQFQELNLSVLSLTLKDFSVSIKHFPKQPSKAEVSCNEYALLSLCCVWMVHKGS